MRYNFKFIVFFSLILACLSSTVVFASESSFLYPARIEEKMSEEHAEITKIYELDQTDNPYRISRYAFEKYGYIFSLSDITKNGTSSTDTHEHTEVVEIETKTKDLEQILTQLSPNKVYESEDGYSGTLELDIATIKTVVKGYSKNNYQVYQTREYTNLSTPDASLVPKSIQVNGKTYSMIDLRWDSTNKQSIDNTQLPDSYKAVAKYSATATSSNVTGYITTAEYKGNISKVLNGKTVYTAYFVGEKMEYESDVTPESKSFEGGGQVIFQAGQQETSNLVITDNDKPKVEEIPIESEKVISETAQEKIANQTPSAVETPTELQKTTENIDSKVASNETTEVINNLEAQPTKKSTAKNLSIIIITVLASAVAGGLLIYFLIKKQVFGDIIQNDDDDDYSSETNFDDDDYDSEVDREEKFETDVGISGRKTAISEE